MNAVLDHIVLLLALWIVAWLIIVGGIGAAVAATSGGRWWQGFVISIVIPVPVVGWLVTWIVCRRSGRTSWQGEDSASGMEDLRPRYGQIYED